MNFQWPVWWNFKSFFSLFPLEIHFGDIPEAKNAVQLNSYSKGRRASHFEFSVTSSIEFQQLADLQHIKNVLPHTSQIWRHQLLLTSLLLAEAWWETYMESSVFTAWSYKPPEHSPFGSLFQCCLKKNAKNTGPYFFNSPHNIPCCYRRNVLRIFLYRSTEQAGTRKHFPWILMAPCESTTWNYLKLR